MRIQHLYNPNRYAEVTKKEWDSNPRFKLYWRISEEEKQKKIKVPKEVEETEIDN